MNLSAYEIALIAGGFTIIGTLLGAWITYRNALEIQKVAEFNKAAAEFRIAFIEEQRLLDPHSFADRASAGSVSSIIKNAIDKHERAMIRFEPFVCKSKIEEYKKAWKDYAGDSKHFEQYSGGNIFEAQEKRALALSRINNLLKFANPKH